MPRTDSGHFPHIIFAVNEPDYGFDFFNISLFPAQAISFNAGHDSLPSKLLSNLIHVEELH